LANISLVQTDRDVEVIRVDRENTVESLRDQLQALLCAGHDDVGFPILKKDKDDEEGMRMMGYIGANELEHALSLFLASLFHGPLLIFYQALLPRKQQNTSGSTQHTLMEILDRHRFRHCQSPVRLMTWIRLILACIWTRFVGLFGLNGRHCG
jgi:hypothetical protein